MFLQDIDGHLVVGGGLPLNSVIKTFEENAGKSPFFEALAQHLKKVCSVVCLSTVLLVFSRGS